MNFGPWLYVVTVLSTVLVAVFLIYAMRSRSKRGEEPLKVPPEIEEREHPSRAERVVTVTDVKRARNELRTLDIEREILSYAIRRLYEAHAEGKINQEERDRLAQRYKSRMEAIKDVISRSESLVALHELEDMRENLMKLFNERFDEINVKIEAVRSSIEVKPVIEKPTLPEAPPEVKERKKKKRPKKAPTKTEAEKRIEEIKAEVEKVLDRLGQIEVEA